MPQQQLPRMFEQDTIIVMGTEWEVCRVKHEGKEGHVLKLRFGDEMIVVGFFNWLDTPAEKERDEIVNWIVMRAAQLAEKGKK